MNGLVSIALIYAVVVIYPPSTPQFTYGAHVTASTILNSSPTNRSGYLEPQESIINTTRPTVPEQSVHLPIHPHSCCRNKTRQPNNPIIPHPGGNSTQTKHMSPQTLHKLESKSKLKLETAKFINAEKVVSHDMGSKTSYAETKDSLRIIPSNNSNTIPGEARPNIAQPKSTLETRIVSNHTESLKEISAEAVDDGDEISSWIKSSLLRNAIKYLITDFYPEKILNSLSNRLTFSNRSNVGIRVEPSVVYPLIMEGVSVLLNHLTENESSENENEEAQGIVKGRIANIMVDSIDKLLRNKLLNNEVGGGNSNHTYANENANVIQGMVNLDTTKSLFPLIRTVQSNSELSDVVSKFLTKPPSELGDLNSLLKNYGSQFSGILSNTRILNAISKPSSNQTDALNLTSIMEQFLPKDGGAMGDGKSPKNPLLRSEFVTKVLSKSPVAHLGALDDNIKKLVTSSLEKAVSRVKIDQNGQIRMSEGMKRMVSKMLQDSDSKTSGSSAMDSINGVLKSVVQMSSGPVDITEDAPKSRRNVTKHSHLHRRFQEKYGKDPRVPRSGSTPISQTSLSFVVLLMPITFWYLPIQ